MMDSPGSGRIGRTGQGQAGEAGQDRADWERAGIFWLRHTPRQATAPVGGPWGRVGGARATKGPPLQRLTPTSFMHTAP